MAFDLDISISLRNCCDSEAADDELDNLIEYCQERLGVTSPEMLLQALAEALVGLHESELFEGQTIH
jgi:hypothetical protein